MTTPHPAPRLRPVNQTPMVGTTSRVIRDGAHFRKVIAGTRINGVAFLCHAPSRWFKHEYCNSLLTLPKIGVSVLIETLPKR